MVDKRFTTGLGRTDGADIWKEIMATRTYPFVSQLRLQGREEGRAEGIASSILNVLDSRGIAVDTDSRTRIESCHDADVLGTWLRRAVTVAKASDLFA
jgi:hypothetical protein